MSKTIREMTAEIREINVDKGWRPAEGGPGGNTWGDYVALLHSEISEALEAYRDHKLADATQDAVEVFVDATPGTPPTRTLRPGKPEGVGSELADVLIRLLDMCDVFGIKPFDMDMEIGDVADTIPLKRIATFGDSLAWLHHEVSEMWYAERWRTRDQFPPHVLRVLVTVARKFGIDLDAEYARKVAYNRTRSFRHGGRAL